MPPFVRLWLLKTVLAAVKGLSECLSVRAVPRSSCFLLCLLVQGAAFCAGRFFCRARVCALLAGKRGFCGMRIPFFPFGSTGFGSRGSFLSGR